MQLGSVARRPTGLALKPLKPVSHAANRASSYGLRRPILPRISHSSAPLPAAGSVRGIMGRCSCPAPRTKARDEVEREPQQAPAKQGEEEAAAAERKPAPGDRSMAYQIFAAHYVCAYLFFWRTDELIVLNAQDALERLRRYVRDNFNPKR